METQKENTLFDTEGVLKGEIEKLKAALAKKKEDIAITERAIDDLYGTIKRMHYDSKKKPLTECIVDFIAQTGEVRFQQIWDEMKPLGFPFKNLEQTIRETLVRLHNENKIGKKPLEGNKRDLIYFVPKLSEKKNATQNSGRKKKPAGK